MCFLPSLPPSLPPSSLFLSGLLFSLPLFRSSAPSLLPTPPLPLRYPSFPLISSYLPLPFLAHSLSTLSSNALFLFVPPFLFFFPFPSHLLRPFHIKLHLPLPLAASIPVLLLYLSTLRCMGAQVRAEGAAS